MANIAEIELMNADIIKKVFQNDLLLEHILGFVPIKKLFEVKCVSLLWKCAAEKVQRKRNAIAWIMYCSGDQEINDQIMPCLNKLSCMPTNALVFCSSALADIGVRVTRSSDQARSPRHANKTRSVVVNVNDYIRQHLPHDCKIHGICADGVVGTSWENTVDEHENTRVFSCLLLPDLPGVKIYEFYKDNNETDSDSDSENENANKENLSMNEDTLHQITGIPKDENVRLLLLFESLHQTENKNFIKGMIKQYGNINIAGGIVNTFFTEKVDDDPLDSRREQSLHGIAFCGTQEGIQVASVVIPTNADSPEKMEKCFQKLKNTKISEKKTVGFMFSCIGRGQHFHRGVENMESKLFKKLFPKTPLFGFFGNGEIGYNYLPDYSTPDGDKHYKSLKNLISDKDFTRKVFHSYSSIFVVLSFVS